VESIAGRKQRQAARPYPEAQAHQPCLSSRLSPCMHVAGSNVQEWLAWEHDRSALDTWEQKPIASLAACTALRSFPQKERETAVGKRRRHATCNLRFPAYDRQQQKCQIGVHPSLAFHGAGAFMQLKLPKPQSHGRVGRPAPPLVLPYLSLLCPCPPWSPTKVKRIQIPS
jgi:hypothetical protein